MENGKIIGVALGPGDPDLITLKGLKALQTSDIIYYPGSVSKMGQKSYSLEILKNYQLEDKQMKGVFLPMSLDRGKAEEIYAQAYEELKKDYSEGKTISFVAEGDITFYSTFAYLIEKIHNDKLNFEMVPGIPAFILAGSQAQTPLALQSDNLQVISQCNSVANLKEACSKTATVVLMKPTTLRNEIGDFLKNYEGSFFYCEKLGTDEEFICSDYESFNGRTMPYFSIIIFK